MFKEVLVITAENNHVDMHVWLHQNLETAVMQHILNSDPFQEHTTGWDTLSYVGCVVAAYDSF